MKEKKSNKENKNVIDESNSAQPPRPEEPPEQIIREGRFPSKTKNKTRK